MKHTIDSAATSVLFFFLRYFILFLLYFSLEANLLATLTGAGPCIMSMKVVLVRSRLNPAERDTLLFSGSLRPLLPPHTIVVLAPSHVPRKRAVE